MNITIKESELAELTAEHFAELECAAMTVGGLDPPTCLCYFHQGEPWQPHKDLNQAWMVAEKVGINVVAQDDDNRKWAAWAYGIRIDEPVHHESPAIAILIAALASRGTHVTLEES